MIEKTLLSLGSTFSILQYLFEPSDAAVFFNPKCFKLDMLCHLLEASVAHLQLFSRVKSKLSFKSIICSFFFTRLYEQIIDLYIIYLVNLGRLCIQYFSNILVADCNNSLSKLRQIMS